MVSDIFYNSLAVAYTVAGASEKGLKYVANKINTNPKKLINRAKIAPWIFNIASLTGLGACFGYAVADEPDKVLATISFALGGAVVGIVSDDFRQRNMCDSGRYIPTPQGQLLEELVNPFLYNKK